MRCGGHMMLSSARRQTFPRLYSTADEEQTLKVHIGLYTEPSRPRDNLPDHQSNPGVDSRLRPWPRRRHLQVQQRPNGLVWRGAVMPHLQRGAVESLDARPCSSPAIQRTISQQLILSRSWNSGSARNGSQTCGRNHCPRERVHSLGSARRVSPYIICILYTQRSSQRTALCFCRRRMLVRIGDSSNDSPMTAGARVNPRVEYNGKDTPFAAMETPGGLALFYFNRCYTGNQRTSRVDLPLFPANDSLSPSCLPTLLSPIHQASRANRRLIRLARASGPEEVYPSKPAG